MPRAAPNRSSPSRTRHGSRTNRCREIGEPQSSACSSCGPFITGVVAIVRTARDEQSRYDGEESRWNAFAVHPDDRDRTDLEAEPRRSLLHLRRDSRVRAIRPNRMETQGSAHRYAGAVPAAPRGPPAQTKAHPRQRRQRRNSSLREPVPVWRTHGGTSRVGTRRGRRRNPARRRARCGWRNAA